MPEGFRHRIPVAIRFADMDAMRHVNHARYQSYTEMARARYYADLGLWDGRPGSIGPIMARASLDYRLPLALGDEIAVWTRCSRMGSKSYEMEHLIVRQQDAREEIAAHVHVTAVMYDHAQGVSVPIPAAWRQSVMAFETVPPQATAKTAPLVQTPLDHFRYRTPIDIRFADMDAMGHVNNAVYLTYIETARIDFMRDVCARADFEDYGMILAKIALDYRLPLVMGDEIAVWTRCSRLGGKSFDLEALIVRDQDGQAEIAAAAHAVMVAYDYAAQTTQPVPDDWRERITAYEPQPPAM